MRLLMTCDFVPVRKMMSAVAARPTTDPTKNLVQVRMLHVRKKLTQLDCPFVIRNSHSQGYFLDYVRQGEKTTDSNNR